MIGGAAIGFVWGFIRHLIKNRNLKTAFTRGATKASLGTFLFVFAAQLARLVLKKIISFSFFLYFISFFRPFFEFPMFCLSFNHSFIFINKIRTPDFIHHSIFIF